MQQRLKISALCLLLALTVVLVALDFGRLSSDPEASSSSSSSLPTESASVASAAPAPSLSSDQPPHLVRGFLAVGSNGGMASATRGDCHGSAAPQLATAGANGVFTQRRLPGLREVLWLEELPVDSVTVVGLDARCQTLTFTSQDGGRSWQRTSGSDASWHLSANDKTAAVFSPRGRRTTPCAPAALTTPSDGVVRMLCGDGRIFSTEDSGNVWSRVGVLSGAVDISYTSSGEAFALAHRRSCPAAVLESIDGGQFWKSITCLPGREPRAIAVGTNVVVAQVGNVVHVSYDSGASWSRHPVG